MRLRFALGLAAVIAIAAGAVIVALAVRSNDKAHFHQLQSQEAERSAHQAEEVAQLSIGQLANAAALYRVEPDLTQHAFQVLGRTLIRESALHAAAFATAEHECCLVTQLASEGNGPASRGFDLDSDPRHRAAIERARDSGKAAVTEVGPILIDEGDGLVAYLPVYRNRAPLKTRAERRAALIGFAAGAFRGVDLAASAVAALPEDIEAQLLENGEPVIGSDEKLEDAASAPVRVADRTWTLVIRDPDRPGVGVPLLIAVFGVVMAALLGALIAIGNSNKRMRELQRQAHHDPLTGLKNRRRFEEDLHLELARSRRDRTTGALLMLDLDNFKNVNDTLGHPIGDRVIEGIADVLRDRMRETDILARLGGDEFAIVLPRCSPQEAEAVASAIANAIRQHDSPSDEVPAITASIGIAIFGSGTAATAESVMSDADTAMYRAKEAGRDAVRLSDGGESMAQTQDPTG